jgi:molecular chaperone HscB
MNLHPALGDFFALFQMPRRYAVDDARLEAAYRDVQARVHPDRFAHLPENERRVSMQWAAHANEAYRTLRNPLMRARYLLELTGHDPQVESNTAMPADFLMRQMTLREAIEEAREEGDVDTLDVLLRKLRNEAKAMENTLTEDFDVRNDYTAAAGRVRQLMFIDRLQEEIGGAIEVLES